MLDICSTSIILTLLQNFKRLSACLINIHIPQASHWHHIAARLGADENGTLGPVLKTFRDSERMRADMWAAFTWKGGERARLLSFKAHPRREHLHRAILSPLQQASSPKLDRHMQSEAERHSREGSDHYTQIHS